MKKKFTRWLVVMMSIILVLSTSLGALAAGDGDGGAVVNAKYKDGTYTATAFTFVKKSTGKPGKSTFTLDNNEVVVQDGIAYVSVTTSSTSTTKVAVGGVDYEVNGSQFKIPTALNEDVTVTVTTTAMSSPTDVDYIMHVTADVPLAENEEETPAGPEAKNWQDGCYTGTGSVPGGKYPTEGYDVNVTVEIKDGKIIDVRYKDVLPNDGNLTYKKWVMNGHYGWNEETNEWTYIKGYKEQAIEKNSAEVDVITRATKTSNAVKDAMVAALAKAETGDKDADTTKPSEVPETENKIAAEGVYNVTPVVNGLTVIDTTLTSKDGKMTALITLSGTGYDYLYFGTEAEANEAGGSNMMRYIGIKEYQNASGATKTGYQFLIPVESLDKDIKFIAHAKSTDYWFERTIRFDSDALESVKWQDGSYTTTATVLDGTNISGDKYPAIGYKFLMTVDIKNGKIADVRYAENLENDGNISYKEWAMDGHYQYAEDTDTWTYCKGIAEQAVTGNSPQIDVVSTATKVSKAINVGLYTALENAETGAKDDVTPMPEVKPETEDVIAEPGVYKVAAADVETTLGLADTVDVQITSKDGKMTALITWSGSGSYDYLYVGTEEEAYQAGKAGLCSPIGTLNFINSSGKEKTGSQFEIPLTSLDKDILVLAHAKSSDNWFHRTLKINKEDLVLVEEVVWKDGYYTATATVPDGTDVSGDKYPKQGYDIDITVQIKDGKIADLQYTDKLEMDGNYPYKVWAMDGHYSWEEDDSSNGNASTWLESWTYIPGMREQVVAANSADVDAVTSATKLSKAVKSAVTEALKKAETGETSAAPYKPESVPETTPVIAPDGVYDVVADLANHTVVDAKLTSKDGKMTALITLTGTGYDYMYFGTEAEAYAAGSGSMIRYIGIKEYQNDSGATKKGYQFLVPVESLDKDINLIVHAKSGNNWFERTLRIDSSTLEKVSWKDGSYTTKATVLDGTKISGDKYPATGYDILMTVEIKDGKIADVRYAENLANDGNISYKEWAMDGHYQYAEDTDTWTYCKGITEQAVTGNSPQVDAVSTATKVSKAINVGLYAALDRAETGDVDTETPMPEVKPETEDVIAEPGIYKVAAADVETTLGLADTVDVQITSKDGKMTALITWSGSGSYDYLYVGTEEEAYQAGKAGLCSPIGTLNFINSSGKEKTGSQFEIPLTSLDKDILVLAHAKSSDNWFHRTLKINKEDLVLVEAFQPENPSTVILPAGTYSVTVDTGAKMFKVVDCKIVADGEKVTAVVTLSSNGYDYLYVGTKEEAEAADASTWSKWVKEVPSGDKTQRVYTLSMTKEDLLNGLAVASHSESNNTWFDRNMTFDVDSMKVYSVGTSVEDAINDVVTDKVETGNNGSAGDSSNGGSKPGTTDKDDTLTEDEIKDKIENVDDEKVVKDGTYKPEFGFTGGSGRATISCNKVVVKDGKATATITFSSPNFTWVKSLGKTVTNENKGGNSTFTIPINLNGKTSITAETTAMSQPYEVEYTLYCFIDGTKVTTSTPNKSDDVIELESAVLEETDDAQDTTVEDNAWGSFEDEETEDAVAETVVQSNDGLVKVLTVALILVCIYAAAGTIFAVAKMRRMKGE